MGQACLAALGDTSGLGLLSGTPAIIFHICRAHTRYALRQPVLTVRIFTVRIFEDFGVDHGAQFLSVR
jgi:hypothetical protein